MNKILLHICCGPCATASINKLQKEGFEIVGIYYNPNIHPNCEYVKRLAEAKKLANSMSIELIEEEYNPKEYFIAINGNEDDKKERCSKCWELRIEKTSKKAKELKIKTIGTTLRISPYQNQKELLISGIAIAAKNNQIFYKEDLVSCFNKSIELSKKDKMYRQKYCGCIFSKSRR